MSSQSCATGTLMCQVASSFPDSSIAKMRGTSPESLCAHNTPGWARLAARPESSVISGLCSVPTRVAVLPLHNDEASGTGEALLLLLLLRHEANDAHPTT